MRLTGKCKVDFEKWFLKDVDTIENYDQYVLRSFLSKGLSMQYGVYIDFFDSVGIRLIIDMDFENEVYDKFALYIEYKKHCFCNYGMNFKTRQEARTEGVKKANEIYNKK